MSGHQVHTGGQVTQVRTVEAIAERLGDVPLRIAAQYYLAAVANLSGDHRGTEQMCLRLIESLRGERGRERFGLATFPAVYSRGLLARALAELGRFDEGDAHGQEAIRIADSLHQPFSVVVACLDLANLKSMRGELAEAARHLERAAAQCREWNITNQAPIVMAALGHVYASSGRIRDGISCLQQALRAYEGEGIGFHHSLSVEQLGEAYLLADQLDDAGDCADRAVMLARRRGERGYEAWALRLLGDVIAHHARPDVATAAAHYDDALSLATELEMRPLMAHCHRGLGRLYRRAGHPAQSSEHLTTATAMYHEMGMTYWLETLEKI
jgi:tetratricopeptide (TPR) repeat protein